MKKLIALLSVLIITGFASQALATPIATEMIGTGDGYTVWSGNPDCTDLDCGDYESTAKWEDTVDGSWENDPWGSGPDLITFSNWTGTSVDWVADSSIQVLGVIVKGGPYANTWCLAPDGASSGTAFAPFTGSMGDYSWLAAPDAADWKQYGFSHVEFCYNSVTEPATMLLFGTGLVGLAGLAGTSRRKKSKK